MYGTRVARLLTRLQGEGDGLILGALLKRDKEFFKPNSIYEVIFCPLTEELKIKYHGPSCIAAGGTSVNTSPLRKHWVEDVSDILSAGKRIFLTPDELEVVQQSERDSENDD